ncbi:MAG TPA: hypothetical protein VM554_05195 [Acidisarcina sp.]|nr:hypothetical protein [Acidisarcina sp.]
MADQIYLSLWFPNFRLDALAPAIISVLKQFPLVGGASTVSASAVYPISWNEAPVFQHIFVDSEGAGFPEAVAEAIDLLHDDFAYEFEIKWDLWTPVAEGGLDMMWRKEPAVVRVVGFGPEFDEGAYEQNGHIRVDLGLDSYFLHEDVELDPEGAEYVKRNVAQLVELTNAIQANCGISSRLLWSESGENLAQKLVARLQRLN